VKRFLVAVAALALVACAPSNMIQLAPSATRDSLAFVISGASDARVTSPVYGLSVVHCLDDVPVWTIAADGTRALPARVTYGALIAGYETRVGPVPLAPGCYKAFLSNADPLIFDVGPQGAVTARR
jgi:hypothetical protein